MERERKKRGTSKTKRLTACLMSAIVVISHVLNNASIVALAREVSAGSPEVIFGLTAESVFEGAQYALESGDVLELGELGLESSDSAKAYKKLLTSNDNKKVYEFIPDIKGEIPEGTDIRAFVRTDAGQTLLDDKDEIIFLFLNDTEESIGFSVNVGGYITEKVLVTGRSADIEEEEEETTKAPAGSTEESSSAQATEESIENSSAQETDGSSQSSSAQQESKSDDETESTDESVTESESSDESVSDPAEEKDESAADEDTDAGDDVKDDIEELEEIEEPEAETPEAGEESEAVVSISRKNVPVVAASLSLDGEVISDEEAVSDEELNSDDIITQEDGEAVDVLNLGKLKSRSLGTVTLDGDYGVFKARAIIVNVSDLAEGEVTEEEIADETMDEMIADVSYPAFHPEPIEVDGVTITLSAIENIIPEGTTVTVKRIHDNEILSLVDEAIIESGENPAILNRIAFDITLHDPDGNPVEFESGKVDVKFSGAPIEELTRNANAAVISHVDPDTKEVEQVKAEEFPKENALDKMEFEAEHFSPYVLTAVDTGNARGLDSLVGERLYAGTAYLRDGVTAKGIWDGGQDHPAYCHNYSQPAPGPLDQKFTISGQADALEFLQESVKKKGDGWGGKLYNKSGEKIEWTAPLYFKYRYDDVINNPEWIYAADDCEDAEGNIEKIINLLYAGYPFDSMGLAKQYKVPDSLAYNYTQGLLWNLCNENIPSDKGDIFAQRVKQIIADQPVEGVSSDIREYVKALYDTISDGESCRNPRLILEGDTELKLQADGSYRSGEISSDSKFNGSFQFKDIPDGYEIYSKEGGRILEGEPLTVGQSFFISADSSQIGEVGQEFSLAIDYMHDETDLVYYRYINKLIRENDPKSPLSAVKYDGRVERGDYQDLVRVEVTGGEDSIGLNITIKPGDKPNVDPDPKPNPQPDPTEPATTTAAESTTTAPETSSSESATTAPETSSTEPSTVAPSTTSSEAESTTASSQPTTSGGRGNGGGGNGTPGGGSSSGGGNPGGGPGVITTVVIGDGETPLGNVEIPNDPVPLAGLPTPVNQTEDPISLIDDGEIPLGAVPKTGNSNSAAVHMFMLSSALLTAFGLFAKKKKAR